MVQVYVTEIPKTDIECPFYGTANKKCRIDDDKCCLKNGNSCKHLLNMKFDFFEEDENNG